MSGVVHFEIPIKDFESAIKFYSDVFGWKISSWGEGEDYYLVDAGEGGVGGAPLKPTGATKPRSIRSPWTTSTPPSPVSWLPAARSRAKRT